MAVFERDITLVDAVVLGEGVSTGEVSLSLLKMTLLLYLLVVRRCLLYLVIPMLLLAEIICFCTVLPHKLAELVSEISS